MSEQQAQIVRIDPPAAIPGGEIAIECENFSANRREPSRVICGDKQAWLVGASSRRALAIVPIENQGGRTSVQIETSDGQRSAGAEMIVGAKLAEDLHMVANPACDPETGAIYVTRSGSRGQRMPVSLYRINSNGEMAGITGEVVNPTGIAFDRNGQMFVTSRLDGNVYRLTSFDEPKIFAQSLGIATGLAFDRENRIYVGDRTGTIYRVNEIGEEDEWAHLESSVSAYHLAFGADDALYVTGPTVSSFDAVMRIDRAGDTEVFYRGLGRPQGLAFDREGNLYVAASLRGRRGIVRISADGTNAELVVAGMNVVGLCFNADGDMIVATNDSVYSLPLGIYGTLVE
jgi:sugar lactone lactonase YvrE